MPHGMMGASRRLFWKFWCELALWLALSLDIHPLEGSGGWSGTPHSVLYKAITTIEIKIGNKQIPSSDISDIPV